MRMQEGYGADGIREAWEQGLTAADMDKINRYTRRAFGPEEVFAFSMVLCDNRVDRDGERFPVESLQKLRELFLGKTCIFDHQQVGANQAARIFDTALEEEPGQEAEGGETLTRLIARAYLPRTKGTEEMIALIDSGMLKEVSVSCAVARRVCSACGQEQCGHVPGEELNGQAIHRLLLEPTDAYECSFVAVPAQKGAGVVKRYARQGEGLKKAWQALEQEARWGRKYRESLTEKVLKYSALVQPELPREVMKSAVRGLSMEELDTMGRTYERLAQKALPLRPQLAPERARAREDENKAFQI